MHLQKIQLGRLSQANLVDWTHLGALRASQCQRPGLARMWRMYPWSLNRSHNLGQVRGQQEQGQQDQDLRVELEADLRVVRSQDLNCLGMCYVDTYMLVLECCSGPISFILTYTYIFYNTIYLNVKFSEWGSPRHLWTIVRAFVYCYNWKNCRNIQIKIPKKLYISLLKCEFSYSGEPVSISFIHRK